WSLSAPALQAAAPINKGTSGSVSSAGVFNSFGKLVRTLWSAQINDPRVSNLAAAWDGTLDDGSIAPSGTYEIKRLSNKGSYTWKGVMGNPAPDLSGRRYLSPQGISARMEITAAGEMWYVTGYSEKYPSVYYADPNDVQYNTWPTDIPGYDPLMGNYTVCCAD